MKDNGVVIVFKIMKWCVKMILVIYRHYSIGKM